MNLEGIIAIHKGSVPSVELYPGVRKKTLFADDPGSKIKVLLVEIDPGCKFLELDIHEPGPEEVYVLQGVFDDGNREYSAGTFIHNPTGSSHVPQSRTGCQLLVIFPIG